MIQGVYATPEFDVCEVLSYAGMLMLTLTLALRVMNKLAVAVAAFILLTVPHPWGLVLVFTTGCALEAANKLLSYVVRRYAQLFRKRVAELR